MKGMKGQMSESALVGVILSISGGFQDAYTYNCRDQVFANAQTGNIVLFAQNLALGNWSMVFRYLVPVLAFVGGVLAAELLKRMFKENEKLHWRQVVLFFEIIILFLAGFMPESGNLPATVLISFSCAMQVESFRKLKGSPYATTMCIGNLRAGTEQLSHYIHTGEPSAKRKCLHYYLVIFTFAVGAAFGGVLTRQLGYGAVWICCGILAVALILMFTKGEEE